jgi:hypothetical protein
MRYIDAPPAIASTATAPIAIKITPEEPPLLEPPVELRVGCDAAGVELWPLGVVCDVVPVVVCPLAPWIVCEPSGYALVSCPGAVPVELDPPAAAATAAWTKPAPAIRHQTASRMPSQPRRLT